MANFDAYRSRFFLECISENDTFLPISFIMFHQSLLAFLLFYFYSIVCLLQLRNDPYFRVQQSSRTTFFMKQEYRLFRSSRTSTSNCVHQNNRIFTFVFSRTTRFLYLYTYLHFCSLVTQGNLISDCIFYLGDPPSVH